MTMDTTIIKPEGILYHKQTRTSKLSVIALLLFFILLAGCQTQEPAATPTPTRTPIIPTSTPTPIPTSTPTPTPTNSPTPTPTLPPNLALPPEPRLLADWSTLPSDLYYLQDGRINAWLSEGTHIEIPLLSEDNHAAIQSYRVIPGGRFITYITTTGKMYKLDRATWQHIYIPTSGYLIESNEVLYEAHTTGETVYYVAWGTQPSTASSPTSATPSGTILGTNTLNPQSKQSVIGFCQGAYDIPCLNLALSPDGSHIAFIDGLGVWLTPTEISQPSLITPHSEYGTYAELYWSPDGQWLLLTTGTSYAVLVPTSPANGQPQIRTVCEGNCIFTAMWPSNILWFIKNEGQQSCLIAVDPALSGGDGTQNYATPIKTICQANAQNLQLSALQSLADNRVVFLHEGCEKPCNGLPSGIYAYNNDESVIPIALIEHVGGTMVWTPEGTAFLYAGESDGSKYLGLLNETAFLDVTHLLKNATDFQWVDTITNPE